VKIKQSKIQPKNTHIDTRKEDQSKHDQKLAGEPPHSNDRAPIVSFSFIRRDIEEVCSRSVHFF